MSKRRAPETPVENKKPKLSAEEQRRKAADWAAANLQVQSSATKNTKRKSLDNAPSVPPCPAQEPPNEDNESKKKPKKRLSEAVYFTKAKQAKADDDNEEIIQPTLSVSSSAPSVAGKSSRPSTSGGLPVTVAPEEPSTPSRRPTRRSIASAAAIPAPIVESTSLTPANALAPAAESRATRTGTIPDVTLPEPPSQSEEVKQPSLADAPATRNAADHNHDWLDRLHVTLMVFLRLLCIVLLALLLYSQEYRFIGLGVVGLFVFGAVFRRIFLYLTHRGATQWGSNLKA